MDFPCLRPRPSGSVRTFPVPWPGRGRSAFLMVEALAIFRPMRPKRPPLPSETVGVQSPTPCTTRAITFGGERHHDDFFSMSFDSPMMWFESGSMLLRASDALLRKATGGNFTPFAVFFANPTTMYVTDEGSGNATDVASHAGLEKWSLVSGAWQLDYVLTKGLIGAVDTNLTGPDGQYPNVTTVGLRNLTGVVHKDGTVTLWATTSTSSASGDNGADPNKVVRITDDLAATSLT